MKKKDLVWIVPLFVVLIIGVAYAYNSGAAPSVMGHSSEELEGGIPIMGYNYLSDETSTSSSTYVDLITVTVDLPAGKTYSVVAWGDVSQSESSNAIAYFQLVIDGTSISESSLQTNVWGGVSLSGRKTGVASGTRTIKIQNKGASGYSSYVDRRSLMVMAWPE